MMDEEPSKPNFAPPFLCGKNTVAWWRRFSMRAPYTKFQDNLRENPRAYMHFLLFLIIIWCMKNHPNRSLPHLSFVEKILWPDEGGSVWERHTLSFKIFSGKIHALICTFYCFSLSYDGWRTIQTEVCTTFPLRKKYRGLMKEVQYESAIH